MKSAKKKNRRIKKFWHIKNFRELFELPDDLRKKRIGPLSYTKSFVSLTGKSEVHEIEHCERLAELKSRNERHLLRSVFEDLKNFSGKKALAHRGYLVTTAEQPAGYEYLASQLKVGVEELRKAMPELERIGLLERIYMNGFAGEAGPKKAKRRARKKGKSEQSGKVRNSPDASGKRRKTLKKRKGNESNDNGNSSEQKASKHNGRGGNKQRKQKNGNNKRVDNADAQEAQTQSQQPKRPPMAAQLSHPPATAPVPSMPQPSDAQGGSRVIPFAPSPPGSVKSDIAPHRIDRAAQLYAHEIYEALSLHWDIDSAQARREIGSFASVFYKSRVSGIPPEQLDALWRRGIDEARKIGKKSKSRKCGAVWCSIFNKILVARCSENKCKDGSA